MNKKLPLTIDTLKVEIKVLTVGGKQLTKSVFSQLPYIRDSIDSDAFNESKYIGYVQYNDNPPIFLFEKNAMLYKVESVFLKNNYSPHNEWCFDEFIRYKKLNPDKYTTARLDTGFMAQMTPAYSALFGIMEIKTRKIDIGFTELALKYIIEKSKSLSELLAQRVGEINESQQIFIAI
jgi:hypothetical protein